MALKPSEYGGADTTATHGIQPDPHPVAPFEQLRLMYGTDPEEVVAEPIPGIGPNEG
jgi:hypothetical protein